MNSVCLLCIVRSSQLSVNNLRLDFELLRLNSNRKVRDWAARIYVDEITTNTIHTSKPEWSSPYRLWPLSTDLKKKKNRFRCGPPGCYFTKTRVLDLKIHPLFRFEFYLSTRRKSRWREVFYCYVIDLKIKIKPRLFSATRSPVVNDIVSTVIETPALWMVSVHTQDNYITLCEKKL